MHCSTIYKNRTLDEEPRNNGCKQLMFWQIKQQISGMNQQKWWSVQLPSFITKGSMSHMIPYTHAKDCQRISRNMAFLISQVVKYPKVASDGPS